MIKNGCWFCMGMIVGALILWAGTAKGQNDSKAEQDETLKQLQEKCANYPDDVQYICMRGVK